MRPVTAESRSRVNALGATQWEPIVRPSGGPSHHAKSHRSHLRSTVSVPEHLRPPLGWEPRRPPPVGDASTTTGPSTRRNSPEWGVGRPTRPRGRVESDDRQPCQHRRPMPARRRPAAQGHQGDVECEAPGNVDTTGRAGERERERVRAGGPKGVRGMEAARCGNFGTNRRVRVTESYHRSLATPSGASTPPGQRTPTASTLCERVYK